MNGNAGRDPGDWNVSMADAFNIFYFASHVLATTVAVFIRRNFGREALGVNSLFALGLLLVLAAMEDPHFGYVALAFLIAQIWRRAETFWLIHKGARIHSLYAGFPYWGVKLVRDPKQALAAEVALCLVAGMALMPLSMGIGVYVALCGAALGVRHGIEWLVARKRIQRMQDAEIEHEWYADQLRR